MQEDIVNWTGEVIDKVVPILEKYNLDFYPFQAPLNIESKVLIIGLNPAGHLKTNHRETPYINDLTPEFILGGNSDYKNRENWKIYNNLMKINFFQNLYSDFNYMNYVYFPSPKFNDIRKIKDFDIINICKSLTLDLIKILRPEIIIILGTSTGVNTITKNTSSILTGYKKRLVVKGEIDGIKMYGIPHPSYNNFSEENKEISKVLTKIFDGKDVEPYSMNKNESIVNVKKKKNINVDQINKNLEEFGFSFVQFGDKKEVFQAVVKGLKNDVLDFRLDISKFYLAFRSKEKINNSFFNLDGEKEYREIFIGNTEFNKYNWFAYKNLKDYKTNETIEDQITTDLRGFCQLIK